MSSKAISSMGVLFFRWASGSSKWVQLSEITSIDGPNKTRGTIDVTSLDSEGGYREVIGDLREGGTIALGMNFTRTTYEQMNDDFEDNSTQFYAIVFPDDDSTVLEVEGLVTELPITASVGEKVSANSTIQITGKPALYSGSSGWANAPIS